MGSVILDQIDVSKPKRKRIIKKILLSETCAYIVYSIEIYVITVRRIECNIA